MTVEIRPAASDPDIEAYLEIRRAVDPEQPLMREAFDDSQGKPGRLDVLAVVEGAPAGCAFVERQYGDPTSATLYVSMRVLKPYRRRGYGTALLRCPSDHARSLGAEVHYPVVHGEAVSLLTFFERYGFREVGRMQDVELELAGVEDAVAVSEGIEIVPIDDSLNAGMDAVALKQAQIAAAKAAGLERLRTQNDLANAPMRRVNEKLGYRPRLAWIHLAGPLLSNPALSIQGGSHVPAG